MPRKARGWLVGCTDARSLQVLVTGAAGRTGSLVLQQLVKDKDIEPKALVRTPKSGKKLLKKMNKKMLDKNDPKVSSESGKSESRRPLAPLVVLMPANDSWRNLRW
eukprot:scaffold48_cov311-Pinguiococcus_pyrenoidosus.AAC.39